MNPDTNPGPGYQNHPDHIVELSKADAVIRVAVDEEVIAETHHALIVCETGFSLVYYIPRGDVRFDLLVENPTETYCPFKGTACYWDVCIGETTIDTAVWGYDTPYDKVAVLSDYVAFYSSKVSVTIDD